MLHFMKGSTMTDSVDSAKPVAPAEGAAPVAPVAAKPDEKLGEPGLAALKAEREARAAVEKKLKEFEDRDKTEVQKIADRLAMAEKRAVEYESKALRAEVAAAKGVPVGLLSGSTKEELESHADALINFRGESRAKGLVVRTEGTNSAPEVSSEREFVKKLFGTS